MNRLRILIAVLVLVGGIAGAALAGTTLLRGTQIGTAKKTSAITVPIISDTGAGAVVTGPLAPTVGRSQPLNGARVRVPELGIDLPIVEGDGQNVPLFKAAHYPNMLWPGEGGRSLLYAHARTGMFGPLFTAKPGQKVEIQVADGRVLRYVIKQYYPSWPDTDLSILQPTNHEELVLLTCTSWNATDPKIIAVAEPA